MKGFNLIKKLGFKVASGISLSMVSLCAFADDSSMTLTTLQGSVNTISSATLNIATILAVVVGVILVMKGLMHLKSAHTGSSQEKHMPKGVASLGFGAALILAIPLTHLLTGAFDNSSAANFNTGISAVVIS